MKILALDSSGLVASVAVVENETLLAEYTVNYKKTHSQTLLPMLDEISKMTELDLSTIDGIFYGTSDRIGYGEGTWTGARQTADFHSDDGGDCVQYLGHRQICLPDHGCEKKSGVCGTLLLHRPSSRYHLGAGCDEL